MRKIVFSLLASLLITFASCDNTDDPSIPEINDCSMTIENTEGIPLSNVWVKLYYTDKKSDFVVDSAYTSVAGTCSFRSLEPRGYIIKIIDATGILISEQNVVVGTDNSLNVFTCSIDFYVENHNFTVDIVDNRNNPIVGRKVELFTTGTNAVLLRSALSGDDGKVVFSKLVLGTYKVVVYDDENSLVYASEEFAISNSDLAKEFLIKKIFHNSDIVITGIMHDPKGSDSPQASGNHPAGQYEYVQLMALKDIDFSASGYCVVFASTSTPTVLGWIDGSVGNKMTYQVNLTSGSVKKGQYFYVGGASRSIASYGSGYVLGPRLSADAFWGIDYYAKEGDSGNGLAKAGSGLMGNITSTTGAKASPDGIAVFKGTIVTAETKPNDVVFFGNVINSGYEGKYLITDNDLYTTVNALTGESQATFGTGTNTYLATPSTTGDKGDFIKLGGQVTPTEWLSPRSSSIVRMNIVEYPSCSTSDIEGAEGCTKFVDK